MTQTDPLPYKNKPAADVEPKVLFVVNPISREGHLDTYARLYSAALLTLGYRVVLITEEEAGCIAWLKRNGIFQDAFSIVTADMHGYSLSEGAVPMSIAHLLNNLDNRFKRIMRKGGRRLANQFPMLKTALKDRLKGAFLSSPGKSARRLQEWVDRAVSCTRLEPDLVFILYPDLLRPDPADWHPWHYPWVCIRFTPAIVPPGNKGQTDPLFGNPAFKGACFLDEASTAAYRKSMPARFFATVPDVCDPGLPERENDDMRLLRKRAAGRTIIFTGGGLTGRKGLNDLIRTIARVPTEKFFFVIVGKIYWDTFSEEHSAALRRFSMDLPENVMAHFGYVEDERLFNAFIAAADIVYAVYHDFPYSSNMLGKAAYFGSALLVSDRHLMGRQVRKFELGTTVREGDIDAICKALHALQHFDAAPGARRYRQAHSQSMLEQALSGFLTDILRATPANGRKHLKKA